MQRTGRKGHAMFRVVVQDSRRTPTSGKVVAQLGSYDPHTKAITLNKEKAAFYLEHGAQPSGRVIYILKTQGVELPSWVVQPLATKTSSVRNAEKRRSTTPKEEAPAEEPVAEPETPEEPAAETDAPEGDTVDEAAVADSTEAEAAATVVPKPEADAVDEAKA
ncbi:MAG: 30S ribosomal protein S16 [Patescibacteria group bacterium]|nr:30S ribosomal protein S16 [Patescibacteria group bacterium]